MNKPFPSPVVATPVRLGGHSAYAFDGDFVRFDAELIVDAPAVAAQRRWSLQLWADAASEAGVKLAEVDINALSADAAGRVHVNATTVAFLPAGGREHRISLLLAEHGGGGGMQTCDAVSYPRNERFVLPHLAGEMAYRILDGHVEIRAERIQNPRAGDNLSGTLALELWALPTAYRGGAFAGFLLGSTVLGTLGGQREWREVRTELPFCPLPEGSWHLVLMLREWTPAGYLTRDYCNFAQPFVITRAPAAPAADAPSVAEADVTTDSAAAAPVAPQPAPRADADSTGAKKGKNAAARAAAATSARLSINRASVAELAELKGISKRLAEGIVKGRPWAGVDDLVEVKGIGAKLLDKLRAQLEL